MSALKIKKGDTVKVIAGKDKGKQGKVLEVKAKTSSVVVEGINLIKKHAKPSSANTTGGIVTVEAPLNISNVVLVIDGEPTKVGFRIEDGKKVRFSKKTGNTID